MDNVLGGTCFSFHPFLLIETCCIPIGGENNMSNPRASLLALCSYLMVYRCG